MLSQKNQPEKQPKRSYQKQKRTTTKTIYSVFSESRVTANGIEVSDSNCFCADKALIETENSNGKGAKIPG